MSVTGYTPPAAETPSTAGTSSGSNNPAVPVRKAPCLTAGSCASGKTEHPSTLELVRSLAVATPPSAEAGGEATIVVSSPESSVKSDSLKDLEVPPRRGASPGRTTAVKAGTRLSDAEEVHTVGALRTGVSVRPVDSQPEFSIVSALSQGSAQGAQSSKAAEVTATSGGDGHLTGRHHSPSSRPPPCPGGAKSEGESVVASELAPPVPACGGKSSALPYLFYFVVLISGTTEI